MSDQVTLTIDGQSVSVPPGTLIVEAARRIQNEIPVFCYHTKLKPVGMCRMCLVKVGTPVINRETGQPSLDETGQPLIRFFPKPQTACTVPVSEGMVVITNDEEALADRKAVLEFLLTSHPLDCPICDKGGECPLQDLTYMHGPGNSRFEYRSKHHGPKKYPLGDLIYLDTERCIMCARCVRFQDEIAGDPVLAIEERGREAKIVSYSNPPFDSHYSGNTADICPVGALTTRDFRFGARAWEMTNVPAVCNHCGVGCNTVLGTRTGQIKRIMPRQNEVVNELWICDKGRFGHHFTASPERLTTPLLRTEREGQLAPASWGQALDYVAGKLAEIKEAAGPDSIGGLAGARLPNEDLYLFQKFFRQVIGCHNVDHRVGLSAALEDETAYEVGAGLGTDLSQAGPETAILVIGSDLDQEAPVLFLRVRAAANRGAPLINAGGRWTKLDSIAQASLRYRYGSAAHLALGLLAAVVEEGLIDEAFVSSRTEGFDELKQALADYSPARAAEVTGVPEAEIRATAKAFAEAEKGLILFGLEAGNDPALRMALRNLALLTGHAGSANNGLIAVLPHANSRGAADLGLRPDRLPGYVRLDEDQTGYSAAEMLGGGKVRAMLIAGADPAAESATFASALRELDLLVVQELFLTETALLADVVLPARGVAERDGSFTNLERRVQVFEAGVPAPGQAWADWLILCALAGRMGADDWTYASADGVMAEITQTVPGYAGMSFATRSVLAPVSLERRTTHYIYAGMSFVSEAREGLQWPSLAEDESAVLPLSFVAPARLPPGPADQFILVAPRALYDGGRLLAEAELLAAHIQQPHVALSQEDADRLGISGGDQVRLTSPSGSTTMAARINRLLPRGVILAPRNLAGFQAETLVRENGLFAPVTVEKQ
ncbi:MAG: NADH-quinone oxidoreductase subunit NuoG, partial [Anaerolineae bacterium]